MTAEFSERDLAALRAPREFPAVSVIMPTQRTHQGNRRDPVVLRDLLDETAARLHSENLPHGMSAEVLAALDRAADSVDLRHTADALTLFAAVDGEHYAFTLPYVRPVARVVIGRCFATRALVCAQEHAWRHWVLALSEQSARLWSGTGERLALRRGFPRGDWHHVFGEVGGVLAQDSRPLVVTGVKRDLAYFAQLAPASVKSQFIGSVEGDFDQATGLELAAWVTPVLSAERERWQRSSIERLDVARSERLFASGLSEVWDLAAAGQVRELLVEEDYLAPARQSGGHLLPPGDPGGEPVDDAVDTIMDAVLNGGGEVIFVPDGSLEDCQRIAASLRY